MRNIGLLVVMTLVLAVGAVAPAQAITNGQPDGDRHPYVGLVTDGQYLCSGALISSTLFVTAAHCFETPGQQVLVSVDSQGFANEDAAFVSGRWHPDPEFCIQCEPGLVGFDTHDVAVVVLDEPIIVSRYAQLPELHQVDGLRVGQPVEVVGYGVQGFTTGGGRPESFSTYTRYFARAQLVRAGNSLSDEFIKVSANPSQGKGGICFGDSGGPVLVGDTILAVNSFVTNGLCRGVTYSYRLDTPEALGFVRSFM